MRRTADCSFRRREAEDDGEESLRFHIYSLGNSRVRLLASFSIALTPTFLSLSASIAAFSLSFYNRSDLPPLFSFSVASVRSSSFGSLSKRASSPSPFASSRPPTFGAKHHRLLRVVYRRSDTRARSSRSVRKNTPPVVLSTIFPASSSTRPPESSHTGALPPLLFYPHPSFQTFPRTYRACGEISSARPSSLLSFRVVRFSAFPGRRPGQTSATSSLSFSRATLSR